VLEVTDERVRFAYGDGESGGFGQWRWQTKAKFANDAEREVASGDSSSPRASSKGQESAEGAASTSSKPSSSRPILSKRK
jgi:hypothetical protein